MPASPLEALQFERQTLQARASALLQMDPETGAPIASAAPPTAEEIAEATTINAQVRTLDARISAMEATRTMQRTAPAAREVATVTPQAERDPKRGFKSVGEFALAVHAACKRDGTARIDERLAMQATDDGVKIGATAPSTYQQEGHSTEGFQIPPDFRPGIWRPAFDSDELMGLVNPQPTDSNSVQFVRDETTLWGASGIKAYWTAEGAQLTASKLVTAGTELKLHKVAALVYATDEVLSDAALMSTRINEIAPMAISWTVSEAFMRGTGAGQPLGWGHSSYGGLVTQAKETSQTAATIVPENLFKMFARVLAGPGARIAVLANRDTLPQIATLKIGNEPSWSQQNAGMKDAPNGLLLGSSIRFSEHCDTLGTAGDVQMVNFAGYAAYIKSGGTRFDSSIHLYFDYDIQAFRWIMRIGGMPILSAPITPYKGSATRSHFVWLATRS